VDLDHEVIEALEADVDGYVLKDAPSAELLHAIRVIAAGQAYLQPSITRRLLRRLAATSARALEVAPLPSPPPQLTPRELDVVRLMVAGRSNREIADSLTVGEETVRTHIKSILRKLGRSTRTQAVLEALRLRLVDLP
jgi:DNA-binding NarL/FixJ family response regulator